MLCRLVWQKNVDCALCVMSALFTDYPNVILVIVGSGPEEKYLKNRARTMGIATRVFFVSWTHNTVSYYKAADIFLFPSRYEGWGLTVPEAMAAGLPVIATSVGCVPELIDSGKNGFIVRDDCADDVAHAVRELIRDPARRSRMGEAARATVFSRLPTIAEYVVAYTKALRHTVSIDNEKKLTSF